MKTIRMLLALVALAQVSSCQEIHKKSYRLDVEVKDLEGHPIAGVKAITGRLVPIKDFAGALANPVTIESDATDQLGKVRLEFKSIPEPDGRASVYKDGYYTSSYTFRWTSPAGPKDTTRSADLKTVIKPMKNPIPMFANDNSGAMGKMVKIPQLNQEYGFDLQLAEALPPLGKGKTADFKFRVEGFYESKDFYNMKIFVMFTNPGDGVVEFDTPQRVGWRESNILGSQFISDYLAPEEGYTSEISRVTAKDKQGKRSEDRDFHKNYYFRTRTIISPEGHIIRANYGKIYGDFYFQPANKNWGYIASLALATTYYNPTPNDRNVEFDPKRNLNPDGNVLHP